MNRVALCLTYLLTFFITAQSFSAQHKNDNACEIKSPIDLTLETGAKKSTICTDAVIALFGNNLILPKGLKLKIETKYTGENWELLTAKLFFNGEKVYQSNGMHHHYIDRTYVKIDKKKRAFISNSSLIRSTLATGRYSGKDSDGGNCNINYSLYKNGFDKISITKSNGSNLSVRQNSETGWKSRRIEISKRIEIRHFKGMGSDVMFFSIDHKPVKVWISYLGFDKGPERLQSSCSIL